MFGRRRRAAAETRASETPAVDRPTEVAIEHLDDASFMDGTAGRWTLVDFWAEWCAPCRAFAPVFEAAAPAYEGQVSFAKLDVESAPRAAEMVGIRSIPTLILFDPDGNEVQRASGALPPRKLDRFIEAALARP